MSESRLIMVPGLGTDARLFGPQRRAFPDLDVLPWLEPGEDESLASYGRRMAAQLPTDSHGEFTGWLAGVSLGGMVALEMARWIRPRGVILIGSSRSGEAIPWPYHIAARFSRLLPDATLSILPSFAPLIVPYLSPADQRLFRQMLADTSIAFLRWAFQAITSWRFEAELACPVSHIHGGTDRIIPARHLDPPPDEVIPGGHHLINMSHAEVVNRFLQQRMR